MKAATTILVICLILAGCRSAEIPKNEINTVKLRHYVTSAISGDTSSNRILSGLIDSEMPKGTEYSTLVIDSIRLRHSKKLFSVLLQFNNPLYNRLAVYDSDLNLLLIDQSLNGNISVVFTSENGHYLKAIEGFISKDMINLKRLSLYRVDSTSVRLAFRTFISMSKPDLFISQDIEQLTDSVIITNISFPEGMITSAKKDTFRFSETELLFKSQRRSFDSIVINQINSYNMPTFLPELIDKKTIRNNY